MISFHHKWYQKYGCLAVNHITFTQPRKFRFSRHRYLFVAEFIPTSTLQDPTALSDPFKQFRIHFQHAGSHQNIFSICSIECSRQSWRGDEHFIINYIIFHIKDIERYNIFSHRPCNFNYLLDRELDSNGSFEYKMYVRKKHSRLQVLDTP